MSKSRTTFDNHLSFKFNYNRQIANRNNYIILSKVVRDKKRATSLLIDPYTGLFGKPIARIRRKEQESPIIRPVSWKLVHDRPRKDGPNGLRYCWKMRHIFSATRNSRRPTLIQRELSV
ncbi:MAG: hypothetical protein A3B10_01470 [Candidatus Doudnabacteria bacterium RIFCSPLOWO2_01_FULL_44_21]|uniref:Uncharacterized protein n=1 Tax=Candidatus Doudnabacteria bacterium RIFCSPLOWO2_01_FULL_44_21 TaxID=1817841 RepID=A0A1F5PWZ0_9BACT|nr:MAG: hypothetical protein A3B95_04380 [Candidatus Doudnabacteria bacterium RIFCSPHIGHO2_02_FULL_43_13b]OGE94451.1 MAG: hypothetical protein A3B10_01470 [Candidatus Doudnabacteria bacterium RIFCSPLOWO2_01_FULL_44_21]